MVTFASRLAQNPKAPLEGLWCQPHSSLSAPGQKLVWTKAQVLCCMHGHHYTPDQLYRRYRQLRQESRCNGVLLIGSGGRSLRRQHEARHRQPLLIGHCS